MILGSFILFAIATSVLLTFSGLCLEQVVRGSELPRRFTWAAVILAALMIPLLPSLGLFDAAANVAVQVAGGPPGSPAINQLDLVLLLAWLASSTGTALWYAFGSWTIHRSVSGSLARVVEGAPVLLSRSFGPAVVGFIRQRVVLPYWLEGFSESEQAIVLAHEAEHIRKHDIALLVIGALAVILQPWNFALRWAIGRLRLAVELDCDHRVLASGVTAERYASVVLRVAARGIHPRAALPLVGSHLETRFQAMLTKSPKRSHAARSLFALGAGLATMVACEAPRPSAPTAILQQVTISNSGSRDLRSFLAWREQIKTAISAHYPEMLRVSDQMRPVAFVVDSRGVIASHKRLANFPIHGEVRRALGVDSTARISSYYFPVGSIGPGPTRAFVAHTK